MAKKKKKHVSRRAGKESSMIMVYKFTIYLFLVVVLGSFVFKLAEPVVSNLTAVLGISTSQTK